MRSLTKIALTIVAGATLSAALARPAEARRFRFGVFPTSFGSRGSSVAEKIDQVYDLPNRSPYDHEGKFYDIGSFYQVVNGSETHAPKPVLVLYSGDRYVKLGDDELALIKADLGFDPTAVFRAEYAAKYKAPDQPANSIARQEGESLEAFRSRARAAAAADSRSGAAANADKPKSSGGMAGFLLIGVVLIGGLLFGALKLVRGVVRSSGTSESPAEALRTQSFDERVTQRLREAREGGAMPAMDAGVRTFGRRLS